MCPVLINVCKHSGIQKKIISKSTDVLLLLKKVGNARINRKRESD